MFKKLMTFWFVLNHILEITDVLSARLDEHRLDLDNLDGRVITHDGRLNTHDKNLQMHSVQLMIGRPVTLNVSR